MSRIILVNPSISSDLSPVEETADLKMPMGLLYLASSLISQGQKVKIVDAPIGCLDVDDILNQIKHFDPQFVGISCVAATKAATLTLTRLIKHQLSSGIITIVGGVQPTLDPSVFKKEPSIDYVIAGEAEHVLTSLCSNKKDPESLPSVYSENNCGVTYDCSKTRIVDLDSLPFPAYHLLDLERYWRHRNELCLLASRGCPQRCTFCCSPRIWGNRIIFRSPGNVIEEIQHYRDSYPSVNSFHFLDDSFTFWGKGLLEFCELAEKLDIQWRCIGRIDILCESTVHAMANSGCESISFGIESASEVIQRECRKNVNLKSLPAAVKTINRAGIRTKAFFMFGFPGETLNDIKATINYACNLKLSGLCDASFLPLIPYPGTEIGDRLVENGMPLIGEPTTSIDWFGSTSEVSNRLAKYRTYPIISANNLFDGLRLRFMTKLAYELFYENRSSEEVMKELDHVYDLV